MQRQEAVTSQDDSRKGAVRKQLRFIWSKKAKGIFREEVRMQRQMYQRLGWEMESGQGFSEPDDSESQNGSG